MHSKPALPLLGLILAALALVGGPALAQSGQSRTYLPLVTSYREPPIFGVETSAGAISDARVTPRARELGAHWIRLNAAQWRLVEPVRGGGYDWGALSLLERDLAAAEAAGLTPVVIVRDSPLWATVTDSTCAAVRDDRLEDFARFMGALAARYRDRVDYWEIGNEPDVDPRLVGKNAIFGCWGDSSDPYYGGERYGRMLRAVAPAVRAANPEAQIVIGGLLLDRPSTAAPGAGRPERFFEGILRAGAADSFDILAYHSYPPFQRIDLDHDMVPTSPWYSLGGAVLGKARFLRETMARYQVDKPLWLNETGLFCIYPYATCEPPEQSFFDAQSYHLVRLMSRSAAAGIKMVAWYTLEGPGWRELGLLDAQQVPRPAYYAYQHMIATVGDFSRVDKVTAYGSGIEAYRFVSEGRVVDVLWTIDGAQRTVLIPAEAYRSATLSGGERPSAQRVGSNIYVTASFRPMLIERTP